MKMFAKKHIKILVYATILCASYYMIASYALDSSTGNATIASIWPCNALLLSAALLCRTKYRPVYFLSAAIASLSVNVVAFDLYTSLVFTFANLIEVLVILALLRKLKVIRIDFEDLNILARFATSVVVACLISAAIATASTQISPSSYMSWMVADTLGHLIFAPIVIVGYYLVQSGLKKNKLSKLVVAEYFMLLATNFVLASFAFSQTHYPLLFVPMAGVLWATYRMRAYGAIGGVLVIAIVAIFFTSQNNGPIKFIDGDLEERLHYLQFFLLTLLAISLPLAAVIATREKLNRKLNDFIELLQQAENIAQLGHWRADFKENKIYWSNQVYKIYGKNKDYRPKVQDILSYYHPEDRKMVQKS